jgi:hypothetical protein
MTGLIHRRGGLLACVAVLCGTVALPGAARADVQIAVPARFLGGPILPPPAVATPGGDDATPPGGAPSPAVAEDACGAIVGDACMRWGTDAGDDLVRALQVDDDDRPPVVPVVEDPATGEETPAFDLSPVPDSWLRWQQPRLRWRPVAGAGYYNVQVFRGTRRVLNAWTRRPRLLVRRGVLEQGRSYVWTVFPGFGRPAAARYGLPVGRAAFQVTLRPRIVLRPAGGGVVAEVRPRIPGGVLVLRAPRDLRDRVPGSVRIPEDGRFRLRVTRAQGERLVAVLRERGDRPPVGLRG